MHPRGVNQADLTYMGQYHIVNNWASGCLDDGAAYPGYDAYVPICGNSLAQTWWLYGNGNGWYEVVNVLSGLCLDADTNTINRDGTKVQTWYCNQSAQQTWSFNRLDLGIRQQIFNELALDDWNPWGSNPAYDTLDMDISNPYSNQRKAQLWHNLQGSNQYWYLTAA